MRTLASSESDLSLQGDRASRSRRASACPLVGSRLRALDEGLQRSVGRHLIAAISKCRVCALVDLCIGISKGSKGKTQREEMEGTLAAGERLPCAEIRNSAASTDGTGARAHARLGLRANAVGVATSAGNTTVEDAT